MSTNEGVARNIYRATKAIVHAGAELTAVYKELSEMLLSEKEYNIKAAESHEDSVEDLLGWVCTACYYRYSFRARGRGIGKPLGQLTYIYDLGRDGGVSNCLEQATIAVGWSKATDDPWDIENLDLPSPSRWDGDGYPGRYELASDFLVLGLEDSANRNVPLQDISWWYAFPVDALRRREDIRRLMLDPVLSYLKMASADAVTAAHRQPEFLSFAIRNGSLQPKP